MLYLFGHVVRAFTEDDRLRALLAAMRKPVAGWKMPKGRPRTTWTRSVESDLAPMNIDPHSDLREAQDRTGWRHLVAAATLAWNLPMMMMMMMMIFEIVNIV